MWRTDHVENLPHNAKEYKVRDETSPVFSSRCPACKETIILEVGTVECSACNAKYEVADESLVSIILWSGGSKLLGDKISIKKL